MKLFCIALVFISIIQGVQPELTFTVAKDGSGNFTTISEAISATPNYSPERTYIKISAGTYYENIIIQKTKTNLTLIGDGMENTTISGNRSTNLGFPLSSTSTVRIAAAGFVAKEITFANMAGRTMNQAVALTAEGHNMAFYRCRFSGHQDTLYVKSGVQFLRECEVLGTTDFIFGNSKAILQNCIIYARNPQAGHSNTITAQGKESEHEHTGIVLQNCTIKPAPDSPPEPHVKTYLGRPWKNYSTTVIMHSFLDNLIDQRSWLEWEGRTLDKVYCAEYENRGPGANTSERVNWAHLITSTEASNFTVRNFIKGDEWIGVTGIPYYLDFDKA